MRELAVGAGQDAHEVAAHALDVRGADHADPFGFRRGFPYGSKLTFTAVQDGAGGS
jgi:hypothetical protein